MRTLSSRAQTSLGCWNQEDQNKMWISDEAARAYDIVVIQTGKQPTFNFEDSYKHVLNPTMQSIMSSELKW